MGGAAGAGKRNLRPLCAAQLSLIADDGMMRGRRRRPGDPRNFLALSGQYHYINVASGYSAGRKPSLSSPVQAPARLLAVM
jgi:hypothetical protein